MQQRVQSEAGARGSLHTQGGARLRGGVPGAVHRMLEERERIADAEGRSVDFERRTDR